MRKICAEKFCVTFGAMRSHSKEVSDIAKISSFISLLSLLSFLIVILNVIYCITHLYFPWEKSSNHMPVNVNYQINFHEIIISNIFIVDLSIYCGSKFITSGKLILIFASVESVTLKVKSDINFKGSSLNVKTLPLFRKFSVNKF